MRLASEVGGAVREGFWAESSDVTLRVVVNALCSLCG